MMEGRAEAQQRSNAADNPSESEGTHSSEEAGQELAATGSDWALPEAAGHPSVCQEEQQHRRHRPSPDPSPRFGGGVWQAACLLVAVCLPAVCSIMLPLVQGLGWPAPHDSSRRAGSPHARDAKATVRWNGSQPPSDTTPAALTGQLNQHCAPCSRSSGCSRWAPLEELPGVGCCGPQPWHQPPWASGRLRALQWLPVARRPAAGGAPCV
jgi:hypothetical protein